MTDTTPEEKKLLFSDGSTVLVPRSIVFDHKNGSRTIFLAQNVPAGLTELTSVNAIVRVEGVGCEEDDCHPFILWAKER